MRVLRFFWNSLRFIRVHLVSLKSLNWYFQILFIIFYRSCQPLKLLVLSSSREESLISSSVMLHYNTLSTSCCLRYLQNLPSPVSTNLKLFLLFEKFSTGQETSYFLSIFPKALLINSRKFNFISQHFRRDFKQNCVVVSFFMDINTFLKF